MTKLRDALHIILIIMIMLRAACAGDAFIGFGAGKNGWVAGITENELWVS